MTSNSPEDIEPGKYDEGSSEVPKCENEEGKQKDFSPLLNSFNGSMQELYKESSADLVRHRLRESKIARKRAEEDRSRLINRIQLLKLEEGRVLFSLKY